MSVFSLFFVRKDFKKKDAEQERNNKKKDIKTECRTHICSKML